MQSEDFKIQITPQEVAENRNHWREFVAASVAKTSFVMTT